MKTLDLIGYNRKEVGKKSTKALRAEGNVPCVMYGAGEKNIHFYTPMILFRELIYTSEVCFVNMDIEGTEYKCILKDAQFHPVSDMILHVDFLLLNDEKTVKMDIPVKFVGDSPGIKMGGKLTAKLRKITVAGLPGDLPDTIEVSIEGLTLGQSVKVGSLTSENYEILSNPLITIGSVAVPRALRSAQDEEGAEEAEGAE